MGLFDVIKFDGVPNKKWIMYKYPGKEFFDKSTLIVGVGQVAIAVHGGKIEHIFQNGTYKLSTENFPFLKGLIKVVHSGDVPYTMEIYFFNTTIDLKNVWGTQSPIQMIDPKYNIKVRVRANGQYALQIADYQTFFTTLMGSNGDNVLYDFDDVTDLFRGIINTKVSVILGEYIIKNRVSFLDISIYLDEISKQGELTLQNEFALYGLKLVNFLFSSINVPEEDLSKITEFLNKRAEFDIMGDDRYRMSRSFDILERAASNEGGAGAIASAGVGLGMGLGIAPLMGQMAQQTTIKLTNVCYHCKRELPQDAMFCPFCGSKKNRTCINCNKELTNDELFCPYCGTKQV